MILITGANGFIGYYLTGELLKKEFNVIATGKGDCRFPYTNNSLFTYAEMDFTDPFAVHDVFEKYRPSIVIHAGAMSKPDECELNQWQCYIVNVEGTLHLLANAEEQKSFFIFLSTDFIFNGEKGMYTEDDWPDPVNFYGKSKHEAEDAVKEYIYTWSIVRTILVYGKPVTGKQNLLTAVREKLQGGEKYKAVDDQVRTATYVEDLAKGIVSIIERKATGIYHLSGKDRLTPYQMANMTADYLHLDKSLIERATRDDFTEPAKRPLKTGFAINKAKNDLGYEPLSFEEGLKKTFQ